MHQRIQPSNRRLPHLLEIEKSFPLLADFHVGLELISQSRMSCGHPFFGGRCGILPRGAGIWAGWSVIKRTKASSPAGCEMS
jgi:hypothetical protein